MNTPKEIYDWMTRIEGSEEITNLEVWKDIKTYIGAFEQIEWERNVAISQLKDLGYDLGQKKKTGHWIKLKSYDDDGNPYVKCSECDNHNGTRQDNYCPECGVEMVDKFHISPMISRQYSAAERQRIKAKEKAIFDKE